MEAVILLKTNRLRSRVSYTSGSTISDETAWGLSDAEDAKHSESEYLLPVILLTNEGDSLRTSILRKYCTY